MRLKRWVVVLAMVLALGCGEEKSSVGGNDARDIEREEPLNATSADSDAAYQNARRVERACQIEAQRGCEWRSGQSPTAYTQQQLDECVAREITECEQRGQ
jgi:hypothetical protein